MRFNAEQFTKAACEHLGKDRSTHRFFFATISFKAYENYSPNSNQAFFRQSVSSTAVSTQAVWSTFDQFYRHTLSELMSHYERKPDLQPLTYAFLDFPWTRPAGQGAHPIQTSRPETPHVHAVFKLKDELCSQWQQINFWMMHMRHFPTVWDVQAIEVPSVDLKNVVSYSAKLLEYMPPSLSADELWQVLPRTRTPRAKDAHLELENERMARLANICALRAIREGGTKHAKL